jgi:DNA (cytosine-5)-methyltransferase 1
VTSDSGLATFTPNNDSKTLRESDIFNDRYGKQKSVPWSSLEGTQALGESSGAFAKSGYRQRPRLLDLFCGAGGAAMGYHRAGFEVIGVDIKPQPRYPFEFHQADALDVLRHLADPTKSWPFVWLPDAIHASPPCQEYTALRVRWGQHYPDLLGRTRELLEAPGLPYVIENVPGSPIRAQALLCGTMFNLGAGGRRVFRHRYFESNVPLGIPPLACCHDRRALTVTGTGAHRELVKADMSAALGIDWMSRAELSQAIPPAYTEWIGRQLLAYLEDDPDPDKPKDPNPGEPEPPYPGPMGPPPHVTS